MSNPVILQIPVGDYQVLTYLVACPVTKEAVIIDPAGEPDKILQQVKEGAFIVRYILNTHGHADHVVANEALTCALGVPACIHEADRDFFSLADVKEKCALELGLPSPDPAEKGLKDGDVLEVGTLKIKVLHTPGHTPGSACFLVDGHLFTGDTLFVGAAGRTDLTGASLDVLIESIEKKILALPKETVIWPGHDYGETPSSTLEREREENVYITDFILDT
jgi:hydroxyacylglutathione hydrolase